MLAHPARCWWDICWLDMPFLHCVSTCPIDAYLRTKAKSVYHNAATLITTYQVNRRYSYGPASTTGSMKLPVSQIRRRFSKRPEVPIGVASGPGKHAAGPPVAALLMYVVTKTTYSEVRGSRCGLTC